MTTPPNNRNRRVVKVNAITQAQLIELMLDGELNAKELAAETGLHYVTVLQYVRELRRAKAAYVCRWEPDSRGKHTVAVVKIGRGKDAPRVRLTPAQRQQVCRDRRRDAQMLGLLP